MAPDSDIFVNVVSGELKGDSVWVFRVLGGMGGCNEAGASTCPDSGVQ